MSKKILGIIPARYASTRFPGKPLADICGKSMIQCVYERALKAKSLCGVLIATDDEKIFNAVKNFGGQAVMTDSNLPNGTARCEQAAKIYNENIDAVINIQGDEPFVATSQIETLKSLFDHPQTQIGTLGKPFESLEAVMNPNSPKIVVDNRGFALYFSRSVIPFIRGVDEHEWFDHYPFLKHLGVYAYRRNVLAEVTRLPQSSLEKAESLEQLRWLQNGYRIRVGLTNVETVGIDTPEDLERAELFLANIK